MAAPTFSPRRLAIRTRASDLVSNHLYSLYYAVGKEVVQIYLSDLAESRASEILADPARIRKMVEKALASDPVVKPSRFSRPSLNSLARLQVLAEAVQAAPPEGIRISAALRLLDQRLAVKVKQNSLREFLRRTVAHHKLTVLDGHVRLQTEVVLEILAERHRARVLKMTLSESAAEDVELCR